MRAALTHHARPAGAAALAAALFVVAGSTAMSMPRYSDGCQDCHGSFYDGTSPKGTVFPLSNKHEMHYGTTNMGTNCYLCHYTFGEQFLDISNGSGTNPGVGCLGCHGRDYGGSIGYSGVGLRANHATHGITSCAVCHPDDPPPLPEHIAPTYYGTVDTNVGTPCNPSPDYPENWSVGDVIGLDNDGDGFHDGDDPDCAGSPCPWDCGDGDGIVGIVDFLALLAAWGGTGPCDVDGLGVGITDFLALLGNWGDCLL